MDKRKGLLNVFVSIFFKIIQLISVIIVKRFLIKYIGNEANGLNSLYISIMGFLAVAELGVGSAITFCMYKPIVNGENDKVSALYYLFKRSYIIIGGIIFVAGVCVMPFLKTLAKDYTLVNANLYITYLIMLLSVVLTYFYSAQTSLINAYKNDYITTTVSSCGLLLQYLLQIIVLLTLKSFELYLACRIISCFFQWIVTRIITKKKYRKIISNYQKIDSETRNFVLKNIKAMFMHKIGSVLVNSVDSIIISAFIGLVVLGKYSNYSLILTSMISLIDLFFVSLTSVVGHMCAETNRQEIIKYYNFFYLINYIIGIFFFLGYYAIVDNLVILLFGDGLLMERSIPFVITINYFVQFMRRATLLFRDATGTFYYDRYKPIVEGLINIILSLIFVEMFGIVGVIVATIITSLCICHVVEPFVLHKHVFFQRPTLFYIKNYFLIAIFIALLKLFDLIKFSFSNSIYTLLANGLLSVFISVIIIILLIVTNKNLREYFVLFLQKIKGKLLKNKKLNN